MTLSFDNGCSHELKWSKETVSFGTIVPSLTSQDCTDPSYWMVKMETLTGQITIHCENDPVFTLLLPGALVTSCSVSLVDNILTGVKFGEEFQDVRYIISRAVSETGEFLFVVISGLELYLLVPLEPVRAPKVGGLSFD